MYNLLLFIFVIVCVLLVLSILMQSDKGGGLSAAFGGSGEASSSAFGSRETATFLSKMTVTLTVTFFLLAIFIGLLSKIEFTSDDAVGSSIIMEKAQPTPDSPVNTLPSLGDEKKDLPDVNKDERINLPEPTKKEGEQKDTETKTEDKK